MTPQIILILCFIRFILSQGDTRPIYNISYLTEYSIDTSKTGGIIPANSKIFLRLKLSNLNKTTYNLIKVKVPKNINTNFTITYARYVDDPTEMTLRYAGVSLNMKYISKINDGSYDIYYYNIIMYYDTPFLALYIVNNLDLPFLSIFVGREKSNVQDITYMKEYEFDKTFFIEMSQTYLLFRLECKTKGNEIIKVKLNKEDESKIKKIFFSVYYYQKRPSDEEAYYQVNYTNTTRDMNYENSTDDKYNIYKLNYTKVGDIEHFTIFVSLFTDHINYVSIYFGP